MRIRDKCAKNPTIKRRNHVNYGQNRNNMTQDCDHEIDITDKVCPLTFVHTRLTIDSMSPGKVLAVRLRKGEALENVPRSVRELGHEILSLAPTKDIDGVYRLRILIV